MTSGEASEGRPSEIEVQELESSLFDPLKSLTLRQELPALKHAFDASVMQEYLASALFNSCRRYTIAACELEQATYVPGDCCILRYRLEIHDGNSGRSSLSLVTGRMFASEAASHRYLADRLAPLVPLLNGREEVAPFANLVAIIAPLRMVVYVFPADGELPCLITATNRLRMAGILKDVLPAGMRDAVTAENCQIELIDLARQQRATLRYGFGGPDKTRERSVYGKLRADTSGALAGPVTAALRERSRQSFHVPESLAWLPDLRLSLLGAIPGRCEIERAIKARLRGKPTPPGGMSLEEMMEACGRISATLHAVDLELGPHRTLDDEMLWLWQRTGEVQKVSPELGRRLKHWLERLPTRAMGPPLDCGLCHGDFTIGQILFEGGESGLVDFDSVCQAEPALDLGQFLAYVRLAAGPPAPIPSTDLAAKLTTQFLRAYMAALPDRADGRLARRATMYKMVSLLRRAVRSWQKFRPDRVDAALTALQEEMAS